jgi:hypothetical protein
VTQELFERIGGILGPHIQDAHSWLKKEYGTKTAESFMMNLEAVGALSSVKILQLAKRSVAQSGKTWHYESRINPPEAPTAAPAARSTVKPQTAGQDESAGVLGRVHVGREATFLQQMSGKVNRHGAEAKALKETREARAAGLKKLAQQQETELFLKHNKGSRAAFERKIDALDDLARRGKLTKNKVCVIQI